MRRSMLLAAVSLAAVLASGCAGAGAQPRGRSAGTLEIVDAWLECTDCQSRQLQHVVALGHSDSAAVLDALNTALVRGPDPARRPGFLSDVNLSYPQDSAAAVLVLPGASLPTRAEVGNEYWRRLDIMWRARAVVALRAIGGPAAAAVVSAAQLRPLVDALGNFLPDSVRTLIFSAHPVPPDSLP